MTISLLFVDILEILQVMKLLIMARLIWKIMFHEQSKIYFYSIQTEYRFGLSLKAAKTNDELGTNKYNILIVPIKAIFDNRNNKLVRSIMDVNANAYVSKHLVILFFVVMAILIYSGQHRRLLR